MAEEQEEVANPYNAHKSWHDVEEHEFVDSTSLFVPSRQKTVVDNQRPLDEADEANPDDPYKTRYDELKKHHDKTVNMLRQEVRELKAQEKVNQPGYTPPKTPEEVAEFAKENPDLAGTIETIAHSKDVELERKLAELEERENKVRKREAKEYLARVHPDINEITASSDFHDWAEEQSETVQSWIYKNPYDGELAANAVTLYKAAKGITAIAEEPAPKNDDPSELVPTRTSGANTTTQKKIWSRREIAKMSPDAYAKYEDEIDQAIVEGRITN